MNGKGPAYWRRQVRRGRIPADDPRATPVASPIPTPRRSLDDQLTHLGQPIQPRRHR